MEFFKSDIEHSLKFYYPQTWIHETLIDALIEVEQQQTELINALMEAERLQQIEMAMPNIEVTEYEKRTTKEFVESVKSYWEFNRSELTFNNIVYIASWAKLIMPPPL